MCLAGARRARTRPIITRRARPALLDLSKAAFEGIAAGAFEAKDAARIVLATFEAVDE